MCIQIHNVTIHVYSQIIIIIHLNYIMYAGMHVCHNYTHINRYAHNRYPCLRDVGCLYSARIVSTFSGIHL